MVLEVQAHMIMTQNFCFAVFIVHSLHKFNMMSMRPDKYNLLNISKTVAAIEAC